MSDAPQTDQHTDQHNVERMCENLLALECHWTRTKALPVDLPVNATTPIPSLANRVRIHGQWVVDNPMPELFVSTGHADLAAVLRIADVYGFAFAAGSRVLDWGVGCGRMARHLPAVLHDGFVGIDVDPTNLNWCTAHMPFGRYLTIDPYAQTAFPDNEFDLIFAHSVMTHLSEADQDHWLRELGRISRGLIILSVHGIADAARSPAWRTPEAIWPWLSAGFRDSVQANPDIADVTKPEYYRDVAHTPSYIRSRWGQFLDVIDILPGGFTTVQDAVICRPR